jgi:predicted Zn-dependent protease
VRPVGGRPADGPGLRPQAVRGAPRTGPLVARTDLLDAPRVRVVARPRPGRVRRFVRRYGWRAYAVPLLTIATLMALVDLALTSPEPASTTAGTTAAEAQQPEVSAPPPEPVPVAPAEGDAGPSSTPQVAGAETYVEKGAGTVSVVDGTSPVYGSGSLQRFVVEVEDGIGIDGATFAAAVETTLSDPRSWGNGGRMSFQRVGAAEASTAQYEFKVSLVSPGSMEAYCPGVGTGGYTSCRYGERAVINLARWATAVPHYDGDIETYRHYVVNHEVGHALGNGHRDCPGAGQPAPVMQQQTLGLEGCVKNAWPYP